MHQSAYDDALKFFKKYCYGAPGQIRILDVGACNVNGSLRDHVPASYNYVGLDIIDGPGVTLVEPMPNQWKTLADDSFDFVISSQTLEHCRQPWELIREARRVLKPLGICYFCAPHTIAKHEYPIDCFRFFADGMRGAMEWAGLTVLECYEGPVSEYGVGDTTAIGQK